MLSNSSRASIGLLPVALIAAAIVSIVPNQLSQHTPATFIIRTSTITAPG